MELLIKGIIKFILGLLIISLLLFIPAGTISYWNAWLFMGLLFIPMFIAGIILMIKNPMLLKSRLDVKEKEIEQKTVIKISGLMFITGFIIAGLNYRYNWFKIPKIIVIISSIIFLISYLLYAIVLKENAYLSRTIGVKKEQKLIERKYNLKQIFQGQIYQLWAQYLCMVEMGYTIQSLAFYEISTNKMIPMRLPTEEDMKGFESFLERFRSYDPTAPMATNINKCRHCIYCNICDKTEDENVYQ